MKGRIDKDGNIDVPISGKIPLELCHKTIIFNELKDERE